MGTVDYSDAMVKHAATVARYSDTEKAAHDTGVKWGMMRAAMAIRATGHVMPSEAAIIKATCDGLADSLESEASK